MAFQSSCAWTTLPDGDVYTRPLIASEATNDMIALIADGCNELCFGASFRSSYTEQQLIAAFREALGRLRFYAPLVAATIQAEEGKPEGRVWVYRCASNALEVLTWVDKTLLVHYSSPANEDFISTINQTRLPYRHSDSYVQYFGCHLLLRENGTHSFFIHSTHAIFDGLPAVNGLYCILKSVTDILSEVSVEVSVHDLAWGSEWVNLPVDPISACGGPHENWEVELSSLRTEIHNVLNNSKPSEGLHPQRTDIHCPGLPVRVHRVLDAPTTQKLLGALKKHSLSLTVLFEAAEALVIFARNDIISKLDRDAHVTLDPSVIALRSFFVPPYNVRTHLSSATALVPLVVPFKDVPSKWPKRDQLLSVMHSLKAQYRTWIANPHLAHLGTIESPAVQSNPHSAVITNLGIVDLPLKWPLGSTRPDLEVIGIAFGNRMATCYRPLTHVWSLGNVLHLQLQASDIWDADYLGDFLDEVVNVALTLLMENSPTLCRL